MGRRASHRHAPSSAHAPGDHAAGAQAHAAAAGQPERPAVEEYVAAVGARRAGSSLSGPADHLGELSPAGNLYNDRGDLFHHPVSTHAPRAWAGSQDGKMMRAEKE